MVSRICPDQSYWPSVCLRLPRIDAGDPYPPVVAAAVDRIRRMGFGSVSIHLHPNSEQLLDYSEAFVGMFGTVPADYQPKDGRGEYELADLTDLERRALGLDALELAIAEGRAVDEGDADGDPHPDFALSDAERAVLLEGLAPLQQSDGPREIRDWQDLEVLVRGRAGYSDKAFGTLLIAAGSTFLVTFEPVVAGGEAVS